MIINRSVNIVSIVIGTLLLSVGVSAQQHGPLLCSILERSRTDPFGFSDYLANNADIFTSDLDQYIQNRTNTLIERSNAYWQNCNAYPMYGPEYTNCRATNPYSNFIPFLGSLYSVGYLNARWEETPDGNMVMGTMRSCQQNGTCVPLVEMALLGIRSQCPNMYH
jgi:hypothetical protein